MNRSKALEAMPSLTGVSRTSCCCLILPPPPYGKPVVKEKGDE